jgi:predicted MarR family transcription regulator
MRRDIEMELHDGLDNAIMSAKRIRAENDRMRAALREAGNQFHLYADYHLAKQPPDREKAAVNIHWAMRCHAAARVPDITSADASVIHGGSE